MKIKSSILLALLVLSLTVRAQVQTVQPRIMVVPKIMEGEDYRTVLEADPNKRLVLAEIKTAFDNEGATTVDLEAKLRAVSQNNVFQQGNQTDLKKQLIDNSGAEVFVEAEIIIHKQSSGNSVKIIQQAYEVSSANSLANIVGESGQFYSDDFGKLGMKAISKVAKPFLTTLNSKFGKMIVDGRSIVVKFGFSMDSNYNMSSLMSNGELLSDVICDWMEEHAYKNNCHFEGITDTGITFDDFRIPLRDPITNRNYNIRHFTRELRNFMSSIGLTITQDMSGQTLYINIQ